ncbi:MAG: riboflavin synthase [Planctomycetota bacterium]
MFTGLVEATGPVASTEQRGANRRLVIDLGRLCEGVRMGDSVAVSGVCLTVVDLAAGTAAFDVIPETLARSSLGQVRAGTRVNLERALRVGDRLGGHFVQGHVDGTARVLALVAAPGGGTTIRLAVTPELRPGMIEKGSIAIDGVSLTIAALDRRSVSVALIPHTLENTNLGERRAGDRVNVELDLIGKWVRQATAPYAAERSGPARSLDERYLRDHGF